MSGEEERSNSHPQVPPPPLAHQIRIDAQQARTECTPNGTARQIRSTLRITRIGKRPTIFASKAICPLLTRLPLAYPNTIPALSSKLRRKSAALSVLVFCHLPLRPLFVARFPSQLPPLPSPRYPQRPLTRPPSNSPP